jgi:hypothetical protein
MSTVEMWNETDDRLARWQDGASDLFNPILVKEVRQALKSRQFIITFLLLLTSAWVVTVGGLAWAGPLVEYTPAGYRFFMGYYFVLCVAAHVIVPISAYRSLLAERDFNTYDLLSITLLRPRQIVWGKLLGALLQVLMFFSAIAPFIAFTALMDGFDLPRAMLLIGVTLCISLAASMLGLMLATISRQRHLQGIISMIFIGALVSGLFSFQAAVIGENVVSQIEFNVDFWRVLGTLLLVGASYVVLFQEVAVSQLTFESDNRSSGIRVIATLQYLFWLIAIPIAARYFSRSPLLTSDVLSVYCVGAALHWTALGMFFCVEPDELSRRLKRRLPRNALLRLCLVPWLPGGGRGFLFLTLQLALLPMSIAVLSWWAKLISPDDIRRSLLLAGGCVGYVIFYLGLGSIIGRFFGALLAPAHVRVIMLLLFAAGVLAPYFPQLLQDRMPGGYQVIFASNPLETLSEVFLRGISDEVMTSLFLLMVAAGLVVAWLLPRMVAGVREIWTPVVAEVSVRGDS